MLDAYNDFSFLIQFPIFYHDDWKNSLDRVNDDDIFPLNHILPLKSFCETL